MIKLFGFIYINPLMPVVAFVFYFAKNLDILLTTYVVMLIHELSHLIAALVIGLKPDYLSIHPFGICLKLKNKIVRSFADEIILYLSGPFSNILMAILIKFFTKSSYHTDFLYLSNILLFITNMLPIKPLDGGMLAERFFTYKFGEKVSGKIMIFLSFIICAILFILGYFLVLKNKFNYSVIVIAALTLGNIFTQKEKYDIDYLKELIYHCEKKNISKKRIRFVAHNKNSDLRLAAKAFRPQDYSIVCIIDENGNICDFLTEKKVLRSLLK